MPDPTAPNPSRPWQRWLRPAIAVPVIASLAVHAAMLAGLIQIKLTELEPRRITDAPAAETVLTFAPTAPPPSPPEPTPPPTPEPEPAPPPPPPAETALTVPDGPAEPERFFIKNAPVAKPKPQPPAPKATTPPPAASPPPPAPTEAVFAGMKSERASRIVYALDASGAMTTSLPFVKHELARSVDRLDASQSFQVVVFREPPGAGSASIETFDDSRALVRADEESKSRLVAWLATIQPTGRSRPLAGLRAAISMKPDLVFLLTRSIRRSGPDATWGEGPGATLAELDRLNPRGFSGSRPTVIKALQFIDADPTGLLQQIANTHGDGPGSYLVIKPDDLK